MIHVNLTDFSDHFAVITSIWHKYWIIIFLLKVWGMGTFHGPSQQLKVTGSQRPDPPPLQKMPTRGWSGGVGGEGGEGVWAQASTGSITQQFLSLPGQPLLSDPTLSNSPTCSPKMYYAPQRPPYPFKRLFLLLKSPYTPKAIFHVFKHRLLVITLLQYFLTNKF